MSNEKIAQSSLGKEVEYLSHYAPQLLFAVPRSNVWQSRDYTLCPYQGCDIWNAYEVSWLNDRGLPQVAVAEFRVPANSPSLIESKSFKLYLNSFNQTRFRDWQQVEARLLADLSGCAGAGIAVKLRRVSEPQLLQQTLPGECLDEQDIEIDNYHLDASVLKVADAPPVSEKLYSDLLRSNCPVTGQPDWGSVHIEYRGRPIDRQGLLKYIVSFREHSGFHENCVETIFMDLLQHCQPSALTVHARYVRRGGLDINPFRSTESQTADNIRLPRQ